MEFFEFADAQISQEEIRERLTIDALPEFCEAVDAVDAAEALGRVVYFCHWGRYHLRRDEVMGGLRFFVPDCPNALAWTVTTGYPPCPDKVVLHATINRTEHDPEFIAATRDLLACLKAGLEREFGGKRAETAPRPPLLGDLRGKG